MRRYARCYASTETEVMELLGSYQVSVSAMGLMAGSRRAVSISAEAASQLVAAGDAETHNGWVIAVDLHSDGSALVMPVDLTEAHSACQPNGYVCDIPHCPSGTK